MVTPMSVSLIATMASSLLKPAVSSLIYTITGKGIMRAGKRQEGRFLQLLAIPLTTEVLKKESQEQQEDIITWIMWTNSFRSRTIL